MNLCRTLLLMLMMATMVGCQKPSAPAPVKNTDQPVAKPQEPAPAPQVTGTTIEHNLLAIQTFEQMLALMEAHVSPETAYPASYMHFKEEGLDAREFDNPFLGRPMQPDHSFLGLESGDYGYSQISLPDGKQAGYVFFGFGDNGKVGPSAEVEATFFRARNWVEFNRGATDPRLPNDVPAKTIFAVLKLREGIGQTPPADYEAPPQESLTGE